MEQLRRVQAFIRLGRLHFLLGGVPFHALGVVMAFYSGATLNLEALFWGQVAITAVQAMTHYANDYFDREADRANRTPTRWSGGSRVLVEGLLSPRVAWIAALCLAGIALTANLVLSIFILPGIVTFALLLLAQGLAWFYSAPPVRLHSRGLGELTTAVVVTLLTPLMGYSLQAGKIDLLPVLAVIPLCLMQFTMLLTIEFPDAEGDLVAGKRTLVVRLGGAFSARLCVGLLVLAYALLPVLWRSGLPLTVTLAIALLSPLAGWQVWRLHRGDWRDAAQWNSLAFRAIVLLMATAVAELIGFLWLIGR